MADNNILYLVAFDYKLTFRFLSQAKDGHSFFGCLQLITRLGNDRPTKMISMYHQTRPHSSNNAIPVATDVVINVNSP